MKIRVSTRSWIFFSLFPFTFSLGNGALAQTFPSKPIRFVVPQTAGSASDTVARAIAVRLAERLGYPVVPDNRAGAGGIIAAETVAKAPPDGHTIMIVSATHAVNPSLHRSLPFDPLKDFAPVTLATSQSYMLTAHPSLPARNVKDMIALARARPGQIDCGVNAVGSLGHLAFEQLGMAAGVRFSIVPYRGVSPALNDLLGGHISAMFNTIITGAPQVKAGRLKGLAMSGARRSPVLPDIPTVAESGVPGFEVSGWYAILAPAGTPAAVVARLNADIVAILRTPEMKERLAADGSEAVGSTPQELAAHLQREIAKWAKVVRAAHIALED